MKIQTVHISGKAGKEVDSPIFDNAGSSMLVAQAVRVYLANQRSGTAKAKTRAEVNRTKKKWFKQKGTGNARHGARSAPIFVGGGVAHGPMGDTNWKLSMSKTMRMRALETSLAMQAEKGKVMVVEGFDTLSGKTKEMVTALDSMKLTGKAILVIVDTIADAVMRATDNIENVLVMQAKDSSTYVVARAHTILITPAGLKELETRFTKVPKREKSVTAPEVTVKEVVKKKAVAKKVTKKAAIAA